MDMKIYYKLNGYKCWNSVVTSITSSSYLCELYGQSRCVQRNMLASDVFLGGLVTCNYLCLAGRESSLHETTIGYWCDVRYPVPNTREQAANANAHPEWCGSVVFWGFWTARIMGRSWPWCNQHHDVFGSVWKREKTLSFLAIQKKYPKHDFLNQILGYLVLFQNAI